VRSAVTTGQASVLTARKTERWWRSRVESLFFVRLKGPITIRKKGLKVKSVKTLIISYAIAFNYKQYDGGKDGPSQGNWRRRCRRGIKSKLTFA